LQGGRILSITQPGLERIVEIRINSRNQIFRLIFELFSKGNVIVTDDSHLIKQVLEVQRFGNRELRPKKEYAYPPQTFNLARLDLLSFQRLLRSSEKDKLVTALAVDASLGGSYAEEVCEISKLNKNSSPKQLSDEELNKCYEGLVSLVKKVKYLEIKPRVVLKRGVPLDVIPFPFKIYEGEEEKEFPNFNLALDYYYVKSEKRDFEARKEEAIESERQKILKQISEQEEHLDNLRKDSEVLRDKAEFLKSNLYLIESIQESLLNAKRGSYSWSEIKEMLNKEKDSGSPEANLVKGIIPEDMLIILDFKDGLEIGINENASEIMDSMFEKAKKFESKFAGAESAIKESKKKLEDVAASSVSFERNVPKKKLHKASEWYSKFKWFYSSENFLVISARNARQNEELIRKHLEPNDLVFHADVHGSPFTIVRDGENSGEVTLLEAAQFTATHSRAWELKSAIDVYYIKPHQVSKKAPSGEYISTGAFMITGKKNYFKNMMPELCVGVEEFGEFNYRLITGPKSAVSKKSKNYLILNPGDNSKSEVISEIRNFFKNIGFNLETEELQQALPSKGFKLLKS
jgi:predicted ribosome quality control (RQC) complex YloA/Tae2 family protein